MFNNGLLFSFIFCTANDLGLSIHGFITLEVLRIDDREHSLLLHRITFREAADQEEHILFRNSEAAIAMDLRPEGPLFHVESSDRHPLGDLRVGIYSRVETLESFHRFIVNLLQVHGVNILSLGFHKYVHRLYTLSVETFCTTDVEIILLTMVFISCIIRLILH